MTRKRARLRDRVGEVDLPVGLEPLALVVGEDRVDDLTRVRGRQDRVALERRQAPADAHHRRHAGGDVEVGGASVDDLDRTSAKSKFMRRGVARRTGSYRQLSRIPSPSRTSAIDVRPWRTFAEAVVAQAAHALSQRDLRDLVGGRALEHELADLLGDGASPRRGRCAPCSRCRRSVRSRRGS